MKDSKKQTGNDQRSVVKNPNNEEFKKDRDNRSNQKNPTHTKTKNGQ